MGAYRLTAAADVDLEEIWLFIARDDPGAATRFLQRIDKTFETLADSPEMGRDRSAESQVPGTKTFPVGDYLIIYRRDLPGDPMTVLRVIHAARDFGRFLRDTEGS